MNHVKFGFVIGLLAVLVVPSMAQAQGFTQRGTRNGAFAGAIAGAIIGDRNNEALAGAAIGGLVGGIAGRTIGRSQDAQYWNGYRQGAGYQNVQSYPAYQQPAFQQPTYYGSYQTTTQIYSNPVPVYGGGFQGGFVPAQPVYRGNFYGGGRVIYGGGGFNGRGCNRGW